MDFVAAPRLGDGEAVVLGEGRLAFVPQVHPELVLSGGCDLIQVGQTCGRQRWRDAGKTQTILPTSLAWAAVSSHRMNLVVRALVITQPEFVVHISKAGCVILPVAEKIQLPALASEENLADEHKEIKTQSHGPVCRCVCFFLSDQSHT